MCDFFFKMRDGKEWEKRVHEWFGCTGWKADFTKDGMEAMAKSASAKTAENAQVQLKAKEMCKFGEDVAFTIRESDNKAKAASAARGRRIPKTELTVPVQVSPASTDESDLED